FLTAGYHGNSGSAREPEETLLLIWQPALVQFSVQFHDLFGKSLRCKVSEGLERPHLTTRIEKRPSDLADLVFARLETHDELSNSLIDRPHSSSPLLRALTTSQF